ncbi:MAG: hypothetical protein ACP5OC_04605 [Thermoplasmata archaeon]
MNGSIYERELIGILSGDMKQVEKFSRAVPPERKDSVLGLIKHPFFVTRSAGSLGADVVALRGDLSAIIEVKSSINDSIMFTEASGKRQEQATRMIKRLEASGTFLMYAYRLKGIRGEAWKTFAAPANLKGKIAYLYDFLPKIDTTRENNFYLKWERGKPLSEFIDYMNRLQISE